MALCLSVSVSVTSRSSIETDERIKLDFYHGSFFPPILQVTRCYKKILLPPGKKYFWNFAPNSGLRQEAQLSPRNRAMRRVNWNLANCHATVQKLLIRQVLTKSIVRSWRFSRRQCVIDNVHSNMTRPSRFHCLRCVIDKPTTDYLWISPVYRRLAVTKFSKSTI